MNRSDDAPVLKGVHHTARPTWKLRETVEFYRDKLGLPLVHAISARGWGPDNHPDFLHFFFRSGKGSTIAFFYYIGAEQPAYTMPVDDYRSRATHTAWQVDTLDELKAWRDRVESQGIALKYQLRHELIESIYFHDPNGYPIEITCEVRPMTAVDARDAEHTLEAAMAREDAQRLDGRRFESIDQVWRGKADALGGAGDGLAVLYVLDVPEFAPLVAAGRADPAVQVDRADAEGYWRLASGQRLRFERKALGFVPALWNAALTGGFRGEVRSFDRQCLEIVPQGAAGSAP
ncbi:VOC family protein [Aquabacterium sp. J223]|uniref:VOC family protein n=1 Tax=Aquabacterium sp. J223 TaxID=2898431 RepID=UPI0021ADD364|nr:VOC family protein [Aquabacterium sp. J223]UUX95214.1 VOC family protein [Aquabacterium sp. J223]